MDLTVDTNKNGAGGVYLEHLSRLIAQGARRILLFGLSPRAVEILPRLASYAQSFALEIAVCDRRAANGELPGVNVRCLGSDAAAREPWDVVVAWNNEGIFALADKIAREQKVYPHVIYAAKKARAVLAVALPGTGPVAARLLAKLGFEVLAPPRIPAELATQLQLDPLELPDNAAFLVPALPLERLAEKSVRRWHERKDPAVVLFHRDPRDALVAAVHHFTAEKDAGSAADLVHAAILKALPNDEARLLHAIVDETFPGRRAFAEHAWLIQHPQALGVALERLAGEAGQHAEIRGLLRHLGVAGDTAEIARVLPERSAFGIGVHQRALSPAHRAAFDPRFRELVARYGYDPDAKVDPSSS